MTNQIWQVLSDDALGDQWCHLVVPRSYRLIPFECNHYIDSRSPNIVRTSSEKVKCLLHTFVDALFDDHFLWMLKINTWLLKLFCCFCCTYIHRHIICSTYMQLKFIGMPVHVTHISTHYAKLINIFLCANTNFFACITCTSNWSMRSAYVLSKSVPMN